MKTILITGASSGIGAQIAILYAQNDFTVFAGGRNQERLDDLSSKHKNIKTFTCDLTSKENIKNINQEFPPLDILLLNAGGCEYIDDAVNFDGDLFARVITDNLISVGYCLDVWLTLVKPNGQLAITSSCASFIPLPRSEAYGASKAALTYLAKSLAIDLSDANINVSVIHPGFVKTQLTDKNTFDMPCIITSEAAAKYVFKGLSSKSTEINFPKRFTYTLKFLAFLPFSIWKKLANKMMKGK